MLPRIKPIKHNISSNKRRYSNNACITPTSQDGERVRGSDRTVTENPFTSVTV